MESLKTFLAIIEFFLASRFAKVVVNDQSSKDHEINSGDHQSIFLCPATFLHYINSLTKKILKSLVNIDTDDTSVYGYTSQNLNDHSLEADLSSHLSVTAI